MPLVISGVQYSGLWTRGQQMQAVAANTWTGTPALYSWGYGPNGSLGLGNTTNYSSPKQVGSLRNWTQVQAGYIFGIAINSSGNLLTWGANYKGPLGTGNTTYYSSPKQIGALSNWATVSGAQYRSLAIKTDGTLWSWGLNSLGELGLGNTTSYSSPKQVGALTNWAKLVSNSDGQHTLAIKTDGTLWSWGFNNQGQLGLGNTTSYSSPKQVGSLTNWNQVASALYFSAAVKTDGTLWTWGQNAFGELGLGNRTYYSSPKQVGSLTTWSYVVTGAYFVIATKTDGTLWSWGYNTPYGELGLGNTTNYSSPKQVGSLTTWNKIGRAHV